MFKLDLVTVLLTLIIIASAIAAAVYINNAEKKEDLLKRRRWIDQLPSLVSTLGVLGTFIGITIGLMGFDSNNLDTSIPNLLDGLKTAFFTSLAGMIGSLILSKIVSGKYDKKDKGLSDINIAAGEICNAVQSMSEGMQVTINVLVQNITNQTNQQNAFFNTVSTLISNQSEKVTDLSNNINGLLVQAQSQSLSLDNMEKEAEKHTVILANIHELSEDNNQIIQKTESDINTMDKRIAEIIDHTDALVSIEGEISEEVKQFGLKLHDEVVEIEDRMENTNVLLTNKFNEFSELLKKSNTEALVEVMKDVTAEFQKQMSQLINKLVQENFEQLNKSVERLNNWQIENKEMINTLTEKYKQMTSMFEDTSTTLEKVGDETKILVSEGGKLHQLIDMLNKVIIEDQKFIAITNNLADTATLTKDNMEMFDKSTRVLNDWVRKQRNFVDSVTLLIQKLDEINKIKDYNEEFWKDTKHKLEEGVSFITEGTKSLNTQLTNLDEKFYTRLSTTLAELDACIQAMLSKQSK